MRKRVPRNRLPFFSFFFLFFLLLSFFLSALAPAIFPLLISPSSWYAVNGWLVKSRTETRRGKHEGKETRFVALCGPCGHCAVAWALLTAGLLNS